MARKRNKPSTLSQSTPQSGWTIDRWIFLLAVVVAFGIATYLTWMKVTGRISNLAGCGTGDGCGSVLQGRWASWMGIPVSAWAMPVYGGLIALAVKGFDAGLRRQLVFVGTCVLAAAAIWFVIIQAVIEKHFCAYCLTMHACSVVAFVIAARQAYRSKEDRAMILTRGVAISSLAALALVLGQVWGPAPATHVMTEVNLASADAIETRKLVTETPPVKGTPVKASSANPEDMGRIVSYLGGNLSMPISRVPHLGPTDAPYVMVEIFDYTCPGCRKLHGHLHELMEKHPGKFAVIVLPCPLDRECNRHVSPVEPGKRNPHIFACDFAKLALAVWFTAPAHFAEYHEQLFDGQGRLTPTSARIIAEQYTSREDLEKTMSNPFVEQLLNFNINTYEKMKKVKRGIPKLIIVDNKVLHGNTNDRKTLIQEVEQALGL
jgi:uncharacterized membrane protein/thiol-disulfide isomerase/thioredoxin